MDVFLHFFPKNLGNTDNYSYLCGKISYYKHNNKIFRVRVLRVEFFAPTH